MDPTAPAWTHLEVMGDATPDSFAQFLVATNGDPRVVDALVAAVVPLGGAVGGVVPTATRVVVGDPSVAAAARDVPGVLWVGPLTPQDVTSRAFDEMLAKSRTSGAPEVTNVEPESAARRLRATRSAVRRLRRRRSRAPGSFSAPRRPRRRGTRARSVSVVGVGVRARIRRGRRGRRGG